jgi:predicted DNA-binding transcriptional regulator YafY
VAALRTVTVGLRRDELPPADLDVLVALAVACRRPERVRFSYRDGQGTVTDRLVEPFRLVYTAHQWYLVAYDQSRADWRTFRVDRISEAKGTGAPFERGETPDAAALVARGVAVAAHAVQARVRLHVDGARATRIVGPTAGVIESSDGDTTLVVIGGDVEWIAEYVAGLPCRFEVLEPPEVRAQVRAVAARLMADHP